MYHKFNIQKFIDERVEEDLVMLNFEWLYSKVWQSGSVVEDVVDPILLGILIISIISTDYSASFSARKVESTPNRRVRQRDGE